MAENKFILVAYDISNNKRRARLHKLLENYGTPVQYSVFECIINEKDLKKMGHQIRKLLRPRLDHVRIYTLCGTCQKKIKVIGRHEITEQKPLYVV